MKAWILVAIVLVLIAVLASGLFAPREPDPEPGSGAAPSPDAGDGTLSIRALVPEGATGQVAFALYDSASAFAGEEDPLEREFREIDTHGSATWRVRALPFGVYAVKAYHDTNGNEALDKGAFGVPKEPYGFSRNARGRLGPPRYADARFTLDAPELSLEIRLSR